MVVVDKVRLEPEMVVLEEEVKLELEMVVVEEEALASYDDLIA
jgi:hypothetical protein